MTNAFIIKVFFRGDWCPWCNAQLRDFDKYLDKVQSLGGKIVAITSQAGNQSASNNDLRFEVIVDEENNEALKHGICITPKQETPLANVPDIYPNGMVQPGIVIENVQGKVLYHWAIVPSEMNIGGATDRPMVADIIGSLEQILSGTKAAIDFKPIDLVHLKDEHPDMHKLVLDYFAGIAAPEDFKQIELERLKGENPDMHELVLGYFAQLKTKNA